VRKNVYDAFVGTDLEERLCRDKVERVVIVGVMTDCCCDTTGRSAFNRGWETWMVSDATGSASKEQHEAGLKAWGFGYGDVIDTEEVLRRLG
jgi:nicotinamidase-related amidase